jgi:CRISPR-associated protein Csm5
MKQIYKCFIKTLSPLYIGCDEVYEPMGFVVDENRNELTAFDPINFISQLNDNDKKRFSEICSQGTVESILEIFKFLRRRSALGKSVLLCSGFVGHYNKTLSISTKDKKRVQQELNSFIISRTSFLPGDYRPYVPGSSIKGSLRTAYLNQMEATNKNSKQHKEKDAVVLEKKLLEYDSIQTDPFRLVKVSDFMPVGGAKSKIIYAVNIKKGSGEAAKGPFQIIESILPGTLFCGTISVEQPLSDRVIKKPIQMEGLLQSCRTFYSKEHTRERNELKTANVSGPNIFENQGGIPIRLGRHSGAESLTIEGHRSIKIMTKEKGHPRFDDHATTFWLTAEEARPQSTNNLQSFGWAELYEITSVHEDEFEKAEKEWNDHFKKSFEKPNYVATSSESYSNDNPVTMKLTSPPKTPDPIIWEAFISYVKNTGEITASFGNKKAISKDKSIVPEPLLEKLKKKSIKAKVEVTPYGNSFSIVKIIAKE